MSNEFDILYNNITSNQAPGLDEYEKSVFLTKAQDEIIKAYFDPKTNKIQEGFDGNERRRIDFSALMKSINYKNTIYITPSSIGQNSQDSDYPKMTKKDLEALVPSSEDIIVSEDVPDLDNYISETISVTNADGESDSTITMLTPFKKSFFDNRDNTKAIDLEDDILMVINEYATVTRGEQRVRLTVIPINYLEYNRVMSKPFKRPLKFNAWRLLGNFNGTNRVELIIGPNDTITQYTMRYIRRPKPIILTTLENNLTLSDGSYTETPCELDPILHPEIVQRAVELAKAAYSGDLTSQVALGQTSQTNIGMLTQSK